MKDLAAIVLFVSNRLDNKDNISVFKHKKVSDCIVLNFLENDTENGVYEI